MKLFNSIAAGKDIIMPPENFIDVQIEKRDTYNSFSSYFLKGSQKFNGIILLLAFIQFVVFKTLYPYPDFFSDSYSYIFGAYAHLDVNIWPIGYSKFLALFHWFTHSAIALNLFQYFFLEFAALIFYQTLVYFYPTGKTTKGLLCLILFVNPLNLYLANYISSDCLFVSLSLLWMASLIWIIQRPVLYLILVHAFVFIVAFAFRYNAMYYPIVSGIAFFLSRQKRSMKAVGTILSFVLMFAFILFSRDASRKLLGTAQFPPIFGGWQWANNALYMREYLPLDTARLPSKETAELDSMARQFFRRVPPERRQLSAFVANYFIRNNNGPLKQYLQRHYTINSEMDAVLAWGKVAPIFQQYGLYLVKHYPLEFVHHFMLLNTKNYFFPPLEKLEEYNLGDNEIDPIAAFWFDFPDTKVSSVSTKFQGYLLILYPTLFMMANLYFIFGMFAFFVKQRRSFRGDPLSPLVLISSAFWVLNFAFSVFATIIVLRYEVFPLYMLLATSLLIADYLELQKANETEGKASVAKTTVPETVETSFS